MASTKAPLFGLDASGTIGKAIVFSKWRGRTYVRKHAIPSNPKSGLQVGMRSVLKFVTQGWKALSTAVKDDWTALAAPDNITKLNASVRKNQMNARMNLGMVRGPSDAAGTTPDAQTIDTVTGGPKSNVLAWTDGANSPEFGTRIHRSTSTGFTADISNLVAILDAAIVTFTDTNLVTATEYFYVIVPNNNDGELGSASVENSGTPT